MFCAVSAGSPHISVGICPIPVQIRTSAGPWQHSCISEAVRDVHPVIFLSRKRLHQITLTEPLRNPRKHFSEMRRAVCEILHFTHATGAGADMQSLESHLTSMFRRLLLAVVWCNANGTQQADHSFLIGVCYARLSCTIIFQVPSEQNHNVRADAQR